DSTWAIRGVRPGGAAAREMASWRGGRGWHAARVSRGRSLPVGCARRVQSAECNGTSDSRGGGVGRGRKPVAARPAADGGGHAAGAGSLEELHTRQTRRGQAIGGTPVAESVSRGSAAPAGSGPGSLSRTRADRAPDRIHSGGRKSERVDRVAGS